MPITSYRTQRDALDSTIVGTTYAHAYQPKKEAESFYVQDNSMWDSSVQPVNFFAHTRVRAEVSSGQKVLGDSISFKLKRVGHLLMGMALIIALKGIVAYDATPAEGVPNSSGWLNNASDLNLQPYFVDYAGIALVTSAKLNVSTLTFIELTNDAILEIDQLFGTAGKDAGKFLGKHNKAGDGSIPEDEAKMGRVFIIDLPFACGQSTDFLFPTTIIGFHGVEIEVKVGKLADILRVPSVTEEQAGTSSSSAALYSSSGFQVYVRPEGVAWGASAPSVLATDQTIVNDIYLRIGVVFLTKADASLLAGAKRRMVWPKFISRREQYSTTTAPTADVDATFPVTYLKKNMAAVLLRPNRSKQDFAVGHAGPYTEAASMNKPCLLNIGMEVDDHKVFDETNEENQFTIFESFPKYPTIDMNAIPFGPSVDGLQAIATRNLAKATDINLKLRISKECFADSEQLLYIDVTGLYFTFVELRKGMLFASA